MSTIGLREFKAKASQVLREVSQEGKEFIITKHGRAWCKLVPLEGIEPGAQQPFEPVRGKYASFPDLTWEDFGEAKKLWDMRKIGYEV